MEHKDRRKIEIDSKVYDYIKIAEDHDEDGDEDEDEDDEDCEGDDCDDDDENDDEDDDGGLEGQDLLIDILTTDLSLVESHKPVLHKMATILDAVDETTMGSYHCQQPWE